MEEKVSKQLDILISLIAEDREEIREIKNNVFNIVILLITSSFALTVFYKDKLELSCIADCIIIVFIIIYVLIRFVDLRNTRRSLKLRQDMLIMIESGKSTDFDPFKDSKNYLIDMKDFDLLIKIGIGIVIIIVKMVWVTLNH